jgi:CheY-like chemotaxis protein
VKIAENIRPAYGSSLRVLVADDNIDAAQSLSKLREISGHQVQTLYDGPIVLKVANSFKLDVILLEIGLSTMNGYQVTKHSSVSRESAHALFIAITGYGRPDELSRRRLRVLIII